MESVGVKVTVIEQLACGISTAGQSLLAAKSPDAAIAVSSSPSPRLLKFAENPMVGKAEALADIIRSEPMMVVRRCRILLIGQKLFECLLLFGRAREDQRQALESLIGRHRPGIVG